MRSSRRERPETTVTAAAGKPLTETETLQDCVRKLVQLMPQIARGLRRNQPPADTPQVNLGPRHGVALSLLSEHGPMTIGTMASQLGLSLPTVSGIIAEVEEAGFAQRSADPTDRRRIIVSLAPQHNEALDRWLGGATAPMTRALDKLSPKERAGFFKALTYLEAEFGDGAPPCPPPACPSAGG